MNDTIETSDLVKAFGHTRALDGPDLTVAAAEVHRVVGDPAGRAGAEPHAS